ncbi:MAG: hypothetical protein BWK73_20120 [Thiothrix lacustris]|uniref:Uncharacterized protein n=1 Tax=Thiothrix lacustris TaxID=525917 RepID=A0A1Y1QP65_9GAMM|nr:MAG: hypothetical protein BWK73_20120 [Thiothrix lacustris]
MTKDAMKALRERLADDKGFVTYMAGLEAAMRTKLDQAIDAQPGAVPTEMLREIMGQYRAIRLIRKELLPTGAGTNEPT